MDGCSWCSTASYQLCFSHVLLVEFAFFTISSHDARDTLLPFRVGMSMDHTWFGCLRRLASSALAADAGKSGPASICVDAASWNPYTYARVFVRQGFNGAPEVVTVIDADRAGTPSSMDRSELGATSSVKNQEQCGS